MAASDRLGLNLQPVGDNINTWGGILNDQGLALLDEAVAGVETIALSGNLSLTATNFMSNQARNAVLIFTAGVGLSSAPTVTVPAKEKLWLVFNATGYAVTFTCGGTNITLPVGRTGFLACDGATLRLFEPVAAATAAAASSAAAADASAQAAASSAGSASGSAGTAATSAGQAMGFRNQSMDWASLLNALVQSTDYSAKEYAIGDLTSSGGSAKAWALDSASPNNTTDKSAKSYAADAAASAQAAATFNPAIYVPKTDIATVAQTKAGTATKVVEAANLAGSFDYFAVTYAATIILSGNDGFTQKLTATGNFTLALPTNLKPGVVYTLEVLSSGAARTMSFASGWKFPGGTAPTLTQTSGAIDEFVIKLRSDGSPVIAAAGFADTK